MGGKTVFSSVPLLTGKKKKGEKSHNPELFSFMRWALWGQAIEFTTALSIRVYLALSMRVERKKKTHINPQLRVPRRFNRVPNFPKSPLHTRWDPLYLLITLLTMGTDSPASFVGRIVTSAHPPPPKALKRGNRSETLKAEKNPKSRVISVSGIGVVHCSGSGGRVLGIVFFFFVLFQQGQTPAPIPSPLSLAGIPSNSLT